MDTGKKEWNGGCSQHVIPNFYENLENFYHNVQKQGWNIPPIGAMLLYLNFTN